ncbi:MAG TPA: DnaJ domain-containing protein [Ferrovibrio sp.]|uniref:DnaJ domain-containing protein n=1 Tax=Ferrovibrio sp. TaxID=1917215 RepID=UPI002ED1CE68
MLAWFGLGVIGVIILWLAAQAFVRADPKALAKGLRIVAAILCGGFGLFFLVRGRVDVAVFLALAAIGALGYWPRGLFQLGGQLFGKGGLLGGRGLGSGWSRARTGYDSSGPSPAGSSGNRSSVETAWLRMQLDHATGRMDGDVLQGVFAGRRLSSLTFDDLVALWRTCNAADNQSAALLEAYLDRMVGEDWREQADRAGDSDAGSTGDGLTREQAFAVLGLKPGASPDAIRAAHRRLMKKFHPDQGGSTHLAAQINRAKDLLLGE